MEDRMADISEADIGKEIAIPKTDIKVTWKTNNVTTDSLSYLRSSGNIYNESGILNDLPIRELSPGTVNNAYEVPHSIESSNPAITGNATTYTFTPTLMGDFKYFRTSNNVYKYNITDTANIPGLEEGDAVHYSWRAATEQDNGVTTTTPKPISVVGFSGISTDIHDKDKETLVPSIAVSSTERLVDPKLSAYKVDMIYIGHLNELGAYLSRAFNVRLMRQSHRDSPEFESLSQYLESVGYNNPIEDSAYAVGFLPKDAIAGVTPDGMFTVNREFSKFIRRGAISFDVSEEAFLRHLNLHEDFHLGGIPGDNYSHQELEAMLGDWASEHAQNEHAGMPHNTANYRTASKRALYRAIAHIASIRREAYAGSSGDSLLQSKQIKSENALAKNLESLVKAAKGNFENIEPEDNSSYETEIQEDSIDKAEYAADSKEYNSCEACGENNSVDSEGDSSEARESTSDGGENTGDNAGPDGGEGSGNNGTSSE